MEKQTSSPTHAHARAEKQTLSPANLTTSLVIFLMIAGIVALSIYRLQPPEVAPANAPTTEFSAARAMQYVEAIAQTPHPIGSPANARVRDYLLQTLTEMGLAPEVQDTIGIAWGRAEAGTVQNIVARLKGSESGRAILLVAHYDSAPFSFGASDAGAAVAAILETTRILQAGPPLKNDVIVLFTDGEEGGTLGAAAFVEQHPWAAEVGLVLNFEARGSSGRSMMFETSPDNGWLIQEFAKAAPHPFANSISSDVYQRLPAGLAYGTDFTLFQDAGWPGLNFAYVDRATSYHTRLDNIENLDPRSLQDHGEYMLALVRHFGNLDLEKTSTGNAIYFDVLQLVLIQYPAWLAIPLALLATGLFVWAVIRGRKRGRLSLVGIGLGFLAFVLVTAGVVLAVMGLWWVINLIHPDYRLFLVDIYNSKLYLASFAALAVALTTLLYAGLRRRISSPNLAVGALLVWLILAVASSISLPGFSYLFTWPLLFALVAVFGLEVEAKPVSIKQAVVLALLAVPGIVLLTPILIQIYILLGVNRATVAIVFVMLLLGLLIPHLSLLSRPKSWLLPTAAALVSVAFLVAGSLTSGFDSEYPRTSRLFYALDGDSGKAYWSPHLTEVDEYTAQVLKDAQPGPLPAIFPAFLDFEPLQSAAPPISLASPEIVVLEDSTTATVRTLRLRLTSPRAASVMIITVGPAIVVDALVNGRRIRDLNSRYINTPEWWRLVYHGLPSEGIELELKIVRQQPWNLTVVDQSWGLPDVPGLLPRPADSIPAPTPFRLGDVTLVSHAISFEP